MKKQLIIPVLGLALLGLATYGTARVYAESDSSGYPPIIQKLVERFGLNEEEVKAVFDEDREERRGEMQTRFEERLNEAIESSDLTEDQKQLILAKSEEFKAERKANLKNITPEERREAMETRRTELESWAEENGIDLKYLFGGRGFGRGFGPGRPFGGF